MLHGWEIRFGIIIIFILIVAVAIEDGLIVPVLRFADSKSLAEIATEVKELEQKSKTNSFSRQTGKETHSQFLILVCLY